MPEIIVNPITMSASRIEVIADGEIVGELALDRARGVWIADHRLRDATGITACLEPFHDSLTEYVAANLAA